MIWDEVFIKIRVSFDGLMIRKKVLSESIKHIETHLDMFVGVLEFPICFAFEFYIYEYFIEFW